MIGRLFSLAHDHWINLSHRQKLASRKRDFSGVAENSSDRERAKKGEAEHQFAGTAQTQFLCGDFFESTPKVVLERWLGMAAILGITSCG